MKQYRVVKLPQYATYYEVDKKVLWLWKTIGSFNESGLSNEQLLEKAKEFASPKTVYFDA